MERTIFDKLYEAYTNFCNPSKHLAVDEVTKLKSGVIFRQYITKKMLWHQNFHTVMNQGIHDASTY